MDKGPDIGLSIQTRCQYNKIMIILNSQKGVSFDRARMDQFKRLLKQIQSQRFNSEAENQRICRRV